MRDGAGERVRVPPVAQRHQGEPAQPVLRHVLDALPARELHRFGPLLHPLFPHGSPAPHRLLHEQAPTTGGSANPCHVLTYRTITEIEPTDTERGAPAVCRTPRRTRMARSTVRQGIAPVDVVTVPLTAGRVSTRSSNTCASSTKFQRTRSARHPVALLGKRARA